MVIYIMVGYGDMVPITKLGKLITTFWMITCIALVGSPSAVFPGHVLCKTEISLIRFTNDQQENSLHLDSTESTTCENTGNLHKHILPICADVKNFKDKLQMREIFVRDVTQTEE